MFMENHQFKKVCGEKRLWNRTSIAKLFSLLKTSLTMFLKVDVQYLATSVIVEFGEKQVQECV